jgi:8-oxo-dGTP pyrophosphatase MutT (NUDIX family)
MTDLPLRRLTGRVIVLNPTGRVLLLGYVVPNEERTIWVTPGVAQAPSEDGVAAAQRELVEETGLIVGRETLGQPIATCAGCRTSAGGVVYGAHDTYFAVRAEAFTPITSGFTELEREQVKHVRWWAPDEIEATVNGARARPPEDVGGPHGYADFLKSLADRRHPEHADYKRWVGGHFDPERFELRLCDRDVRGALTPNRPIRLKQPRPHRARSTPYTRASFAWRSHRRVTPHVEVADSKASACSRRQRTNLHARTSWTDAVRSSSRRTERHPASH